MTPEEAREWLRGQRSMCNVIPKDPLETWHIRIAEADAFLCQQAYWVDRANREQNASAAKEKET